MMKRKKYLIMLYVVILYVSLSVVPTNAVYESINQDFSVTLTCDGWLLVKGTATTYSDHADLNYSHAGAVVYKDSSYYDSDYEYAGIAEVASAFMLNCSEDYSSNWYMDYFHNFNYFNGHNNRSYNGTLFP